METGLDRYVSDVFDGPLVDIPVRPLPLSREAEDFINGFLFGGGEIADCSCVCSSPFEDYLLWLKDRFAGFSIDSFIKAKEPPGHVKGLRRIWVFETARYKELEQFVPAWYQHKHKITVPENLYARTPPAALFLLYLQGGIFYEFKGARYLLITPPFPVSCLGVIKILGSRGITEVKKRRKDVLVKEGGQEKFFNYILSCGYSIPRCFYRKFPAEVNPGFQTRAEKV
jgi:hypothetical protein